ncbi:hypothetical protein E6R62_01895, partial [Streptomyces sp. A1136]
EPHPPKWTGYQLLALIFGTLLSSQGTDASFVLTLAGFPPGASCVLRFVLAFPTLSDSFVSDSRSKRDSLSGSPLSRFPFRRDRLYQCFSGCPTTRRSARRAHEEGSSSRSVLQRGVPVHRWFARCSRGTSWRDSRQYRRRRCPGKSIQAMV